MKILFGSALYHPNVVGGAERVVQLLAERLVRLGHEVSVLTTQPHGPASRRDINGVDVHYLPVINIYRPFAGRDASTPVKLLWRMLDSRNRLMSSALSRVLAAVEPDVLNTHNLTGLSVELWAQARSRGTPIVHTLHDQYLLCHRSTMFKPPRNCTTRCISCKLLCAPRIAATRATTAVIGVSEFVLQRHRHYGAFAGKPGHVIYNTEFRKEPLPRTEGRSGATRFGFLGQIIPTKGIAELIDAFARYSDPHAELVIGGRIDSTYAAELQARSAGDTRIRWLGYVAPEAFFAQIDILVVPSTWHDTAPLVIFEAFANGVPVLGAKRGGIPELIDQDCGWVFDPDRDDALYAALERCRAALPRIEAMRGACTAFADKMRALPWAQRYLSVFESAIAAGGASGQPARRL